MMENTPDRSGEDIQSSATPIISKNRQIRPSEISAASSALSDHFSMSNNTVRSFKVEAGQAIRPSSSTETQFKHILEPSNLCMNPKPDQEEATLEKSPVTDTDGSEPKTGTTTVSFKTDESSLTFPGQDQTVSDQRERTSFDNDKEGPSMIGEQTLESHPFLTFGTSNQETKDMLEPNIIGFQGRDHINEGRQRQSTSMWADRVAGFSLTASAPEFLPQIMKNLKSEGGFEIAPQKIPLAKTTTTPVYNPLAVEWRPNNQRKDTGILEDGQIQSIRPQLTLNIREIQPVGTLEPRNFVSLSNLEKDTQKFQLSDEKSAGITERGDTKLASAATIPSEISYRPDKTFEEQKPDVNLTAELNTATAQLRTTILHDGRTLAQRRVERKLAQCASSPIKPQPHSLITAQEPSKTDTVTSLQFSPATGTQLGKPHLFSHAQSLSWKILSSSEPGHRAIQPELAKWAKVEENLLRMGLIKRFPGKPDSGSFVVPRNFEQWLDFRAGQTEDLLEQNAAESRRKASEIEAVTGGSQVLSIDKSRAFFFESQKKSKSIKIGLAMGGKQYHDGRSTVLAHPSTWSPWYQPTEERPEALWPCAEEMKEEGDERHTSAFGRFLALPRVPGNPTVIWKVKPVIPALLFDEVWKVPNKDTWAELHIRKPDDIQEEYMRTLIGRSLFDAINY